MSDIANQNVMELTNLGVDYVGQPAIDSVNLSVKTGEIFGLMGVNGAGKTTMIKSILGLRDPDRGEISIMGRDRLSFESKSRVSYLPEKFDPPWFLSGMEFLKFSAQLYKSDFDSSQMEAAAESLALDPLALKRRVQTYSKGMRQKLGLIGTILTGASFFILDEPMSGLDPRARALVKKLILEMHGKDKTFFLSSHILADMDEICDRVALLHDQAIQFVGTPAELKAINSSASLEHAFLEHIEKKKIA